MRRDSLHNLQQDIKYCPHYKIQQMCEVLSQKVSVNSSGTNYYMLYFILSSFQPMSLLFNQNSI